MITISILIGLWLTETISTPAFLVGLSGACLVLFLL